MEAIGHYQVKPFYRGGLGRTECVMEPTTITALATAIAGAAAAFLWAWGHSRVQRQ